MAARSVVPARTGSVTPTGSSPPPLGGGGSSILRSEETELNDYLGFLKSGGSKYPIDLLKSAGVDMLSPEPVRTALEKFSKLVDELEQVTSNP